MRQINSLLFSASDLICEGGSLCLRHEEYRLDADGGGGAADGVRVARKILVVSVGGRYGVGARSGCVPDRLCLDARGVLEAAGPDCRRAGDEGAVLVHRRADHPVMHLLVGSDTGCIARYRTATSVPSKPVLMAYSSCPVQKQEASKKGNISARRSIDTPSAFGIP